MSYAVLHAAISAEINARAPQPITAFKRGELMKLGSSCLQVTNRRGGRVQCQRIVSDGTSADHFNLAPDVQAVRVSRAEVDQLVACWRSGEIKPASILDGLRPAINAYLAAVRVLDDQ